MAKVNQVILVVLDSVGIGDAPDAEAYGDAGSNTIGNIALAVGGLSVPNMAALGLGHLGNFKGIPAVEKSLGAYGRLTEVSAGKDTTTGHWELAGCSSSKAFPTFPNGFPTEFVRAFESRIGCSSLGNHPASGTVIIEQLGAEHVATGKPIIYTSADSVFQIAAHEDVIPLPKLYEMCEIAREMLTGDLAVGRVIARPFIGNPGSFKRTEHRRDFSLYPPHDTILDVVKAAGLMMAGVGKIEDIFAHRGLTISNHTGNNNTGIAATIEFIKTHRPGLTFANLVDFDALYGHRNDVPGYARTLEEFDRRLPEILNVLGDGDVLMMTADHGNDPTTPSTDHSRERVPLLIAGKPVRSGVDIGTRSTFADVAATIAAMLGVPGTGEGAEFASHVLR
ncbi:MAG TPA: phosphopentomutase [Anaerolineales bacterium]|nr:phosphopentomutase [Anaerolineales bacterium]